LAGHERSVHTCASGSYECVAEPAEAMPDIRIRRSINMAGPSHQLGAGTGHKG